MVTNTVFYLGESVARLADKEEGGFLSGADEGALEDSSAGKQSLLLIAKKILLIDAAAAHVDKRDNDAEYTTTPSTVISYSVNC